MSSYIDQIEVQIPCQCGLKVTKSIGWIKKHRQFTCLCGEIISIDPERLTEEISKAEAAMAEFESAFINNRPR